MLVETHMQSIEWWNFQSPRMTLNLYFKGNVKTLQNFQQHRVLCGLSMTAVLSHSVTASTVFF